VGYGHYGVDGRGRYCIPVLRSRPPTDQAVRDESTSQPVSLDTDAALAQLVANPGYKAKPERILLLHLVAFDWNCPQHITRRLSEAEIADATRPLRERLTALEAENAELRGKLAMACARRSRRKSL
jgi:Flp pilus assembly protein TadD